MFEGLFTQSIQTLSSYRDDTSYLSSLTDINMHNESIHQLYDLLVESPCSTFDDCIHWAMKLFHSIFYTEIQNIIHQFPVSDDDDDVI